LIYFVTYQSPKILEIVNNENEMKMKCLLLKKNSRIKANYIFREAF